MGWAELRTKDDKVLAGSDRLDRTENRYSLMHRPCRTSQIKVGEARLG